jgi:hemerythrin-like metal-binding protein
MSHQSQAYPETLYRAFPWLLILSGVLVASRMHHASAGLGAALMMGTGCCIALRRGYYRWAFSRSNGSVHLPRWSKSGRLAKANLQLSWRSSFELGHPVLDAQHRRMFGLCSQLLGAASSQSSRDKVKPLFAQLVEHMNVHLRTESAVVSMTATGAFAEHHEDYKRLLYRARGLLERMNSGHPVGRRLVDFVTYDLVLQHLFKEVQKPEVIAVGLIAPQSEVARKPASVAPARRFFAGDSLESLVQRDCSRMTR